MGPSKKLRFMLIVVTIGLSSADSAKKICQNKYQTVMMAYALDECKVKCVLSITSVKDAVQPNGKSCGTNMACSNGYCLDVQSNKFCQDHWPKKSFQKITSSECAITCEATTGQVRMYPMDSGTSCPSNQVCNSGKCVSQDDLQTCQNNLKGKVFSKITCDDCSVTCETAGDSTLTSTFAKPDDTPCQNNMVCYKGRCTDPSLKQLCNKSMKGSVITDIMVSDCSVTCMSDSGMESIEPYKQNQTCKIWGTINGVCKDRACSFI